MSPNKNVLVDVEEAKRYTFNYGVGLEFQTGQPSAVGTNQAQGQTGVSPRVSLGVTRLNFRGRNHTITFKADVGSLQQRGLLSYTAPRWFNSPDWKLSFTAFYDNTLDVTTFTSQRLEGSVQAEQIISRATTMDYRFTYRRVKASNIEISPALIPLLSLPVRVGEPGFSYIRNKRDNNLEATKGSYTTIDAGVAASFFGSEADFSRILAQNSTYHAFGKNRPAEKKFVFARSLRIGVESTFGNTVTLPPGQACPDPTQVNCPSTSVIPLAERFLSGGGNSHRGFGLNQAGPRDPVTGFPVGGSALFLNNLELRFPPTSLPFFQDNISFAVFEDAGNIFTDGRGMLDSLLRWRQKDPQVCLQQSTAKNCDYNYVSHALGVGVRYKTPIGPVRFDFGYNLNPPAFPSTQTVTGQQVGTFVGQHAPSSNPPRAPVSQRGCSATLPCVGSCKRRRQALPCSLAAAIGALIWANVDASSYARVWQTRLSVHVGQTAVSLDLRGWINSGLMSFFFLVVGLEARREFDIGEFRERPRIILPVLAGLGGMVCAIGLYLAINAGRTSAHGWGVAMSTDTAFALGLLALLGRHAPNDYADSFSR